MNSKNIQSLKKRILLLGIACAISLLPSLKATSSEDGSDDFSQFEQNDYDTQSMRDAYNALQALSQNSKNTESLGKSSLSESCKIIARIGQDQLNSYVQKNNLPDLVQKINPSQICASFNTENNTGNLSDHLSETALDLAADEIVKQARQTNLPYLENIELEGKISGKENSYSVTTIHPLWNDPLNNHYLFNQLSWYHQGTNTDDGDPDNTANVGLAYRRLYNNDTLLVGGNIFFDHQLDQNHNRISLGLDAQTSLYGFATNYYIPLTQWKKIDNLYEAAALSGWDMEFSGKLPEYPNWTLFTKAYMWNAKEGNDDIYGYNTNVEWSPMDALIFSAGIEDENHRQAEGEASLRLNLNFNEPIEEQFTYNNELKPVTERIWSKVRRENLIRTQVRKRETTAILVTQSIGSNFAITDDGTVDLSAGSEFNMPATVQVANTIGAVLTLRFNDNATLALAQNTRVIIEPEQITLISGSMNYVSGSTNIVINVPGGIITLLGTNIDAVTDGTDTTVRVRDGTIRLTGTSSGSVALTDTMMGQTVSNIASSVGTGSATYISHENTITQTIDWIASTNIETKAAPYIDAAPYIIFETLTPGSTILIGVPFSKTVSFSGGPPELDILVGATARTATYVSGNGTDELVFGYTVQGADAGATSVTLIDFLPNGSSIANGSQTAVTNVITTLMNLSGTVTDNVAPTGYAVAFTTDPINNANETAVAFQLTGAEIGTTYNYSITSDSGAGSVTGSGTITTATQNVTGINVSSLSDGTLTVSVTLTDASANVGTAVTDTVTKSTEPVFSFESHSVNLTDLNSYTFAGADIGDAAADRLVIAVVLTSGIRTEITGISFDGTPATIHAQGNASANRWQNAAVASLAIPTGTTSTINVTTTDPARQCHVFLYRATNLNSMTPTGASAGAYQTQINLSVPVSEGGFIVGGAHVELAAGSPAIWTTANALATTDGQGPDDFYHYYAGHSTGLAANASYPVGFRNGNNNYWFGAAIASWR